MVLDERLDDRCGFVVYDCDVVYVFVLFFIIVLDLLLLVYCSGIFLMVDSCDDLDIFWVEFKLCVILLLDGFYMLYLFVCMLCCNCFWVSCNEVFVEVFVVCVVLC